MPYHEAHEGHEELQPRITEIITDFFSHKKAQKAQGFSNHGFHGF
jgi:hypothetical protein